MTNAQVSNINDYQKSVDSTWTNYKIHYGLQKYGAELCLARYSGPTPSQTDFNVISDNNTRSCYSTYKIGGLENKMCRPFTFSEFSNIPEFTKNIDYNWEDYKILWAQSFINISFLVLGILVFIF